MSQLNLTEIRKNLRSTTAADRKKVENKLGDVDAYLMAQMSEDDLVWLKSIPDDIWDPLCLTLRSTVFWSTELASPVMPVRTLKDLANTMLGF